MSPIRRLPIKGSTWFLKRPKSRSTSRTPSACCASNHRSATARSVIRALAAAPIESPRILQATRLMELAERAGFVGSKSDEATVRRLHPVRETVGIETAKANSSCACCSRPPLLEPLQHIRLSKTKLTARPHVRATVKHPVADRPCMNTDALADLFGAHELRCGLLLTTQCIRKGITNDLPKVGSGRDDQIDGVAHRLGSRSRSGSIIRSICSGVSPGGRSSGGG